jgi:hypothetical protein
MSKVTVAEKLSAIGNNMARVYDTGFEKGHDQGFEEGKQFGDYAQGFEEGKKAERDAFWDAFQTASRRRWDSAFQNSCWNDDTFYPKYDLIPIGSAASLFRYCGITDLEKRLEECGVILDTSGATNLNCGFGESLALTVIPTINLTKCTASSATSGLVSGCISLKTIRKIIVSEMIMLPNSFANCPMLENIAFEGVIGQDIDFNSCTKLTEASIESIITHLSDTASGKTLTLSKVAVDNAYGWYIGGSFAPGSSSGAWDALVVSKPNWTITLV